ncbi:Na+/H+-dicarboxylate symporter [Mesobacillus stamsii]|uniref:Na+/H+-dicarboxylate symporter n=1 Tax=Mesobacillus stamsii TaxID=225347 RepID=A0ABU0FRN9_9BACI|nr:hypothetical protein [Mesobacillus stamsii]MDQ0412390.1 Na+/H+-dicarboxylate symporter [Mesobacillus stamsii]
MESEIHFVVFADGDMLAIIIFFFLVFGLGISAIGEKEIQVIASSKEQLTHCYIACSRFSVHCRY